MTALNKQRPKWWHVFLADLKIRVSRFKFLGKFRYILPFIPILLFLFQFFFIIIYPASSFAPYAIILQGFIDNRLFQIQTIIVAMIIFLGFNGSINHFAQYTKIEELEIISGAPIQTRSYLFGKFLSLQLNTIIVIPFIVLGQLEIARVISNPLHWWYFIVYIIAISILYFSCSWLGLTLAPRLVYSASQYEKGKQMKRMNLASIILNLVLVIQTIIPFILTFLLDPHLYQQIFIYTPHGWFGILGEAMFNNTNIVWRETLFGLGAILFSCLFLVLSYYRTNFSLNLEDFESLITETYTKAKKPWSLPILERLPIPFKNTTKAFVLMESRKRTLGNMMTILVGIIFVAVLILGNVFSYLDWSTYVFIGACIFGLLLFFSSSIEGLQLLFGARNTFLIAQSAPKGIRKMLVGKLLQIIWNNIFDYICVGILLLIFYTDKLVAILLTIVIISLSWNGLALGVLALSFAPFFEMADITSNPVRGLQITLPTNVNLMVTGSLLIFFITIFGYQRLAIVIAIVISYLILFTVFYYFLAERLLLKFDT